MRYLYHFKPADFRGTRLLPLSRIREIHPDLAEGYAAKYLDRPKLIERRITPLACLWNEVIHLSPVHPQLILNVWKEFGFPLPAEKRLAFKIPVDLLDEKSTVTFVPTGRIPFQGFAPFSKSGYIEQDCVRQEQIKDWREEFRNGHRLFWYSSTLHVVTKIEIDVSSCEIVPIE